MCKYIFLFQHNIYLFIDLSTFYCQFSFKSWTWTWPFVIVHIRMFKYIPQSIYTSSLEELWNNTLIGTQSNKLLFVHTFQTHINTCSFACFSFTHSLSHPHAAGWFLSPIKLHFPTKLILSNLELPVVNPLWCAATELCLCVCVWHTCFCVCVWSREHSTIDLNEKTDCNQHILVGNH